MRQKMVGGAHPTGLTAVAFSWILGQAHEAGWANDTWDRTKMRNSALPADIVTADDYKLKNPEKSFEVAGKAIWPRKWRNFTEIPADMKAWQPKNNTWQGEAVAFGIIPNEDLKSAQYWDPFLTKEVFENKQTENLDGEPAPEH